MIGIEFRLAMYVKLHIGEKSGEMMKIEEREREGKKESEKKTKRRMRRKEETREREWEKNRERNGEERERNGEEVKSRRKTFKRKVELNTGQWLSGMDSVRKVVNQHTHRKE